MSRDQIMFVKRSGPSSELKEVVEEQVKAQIREEKDKERLQILYWSLKGLWWEEEIWHSNKELPYSKIEVDGMYPTSKQY